MDGIGSILTAFIPGLIFVLSVGLIVYSIAKRRSAKLRFVILFVAASDFTQVCVFCGSVRSLTYVLADGYWWLGYSCQHVIVSQVGIRQKFSVDGTGRIHETY